MQVGPWHWCHQICERAAHPIGALQFQRFSYSQVLVRPCLVVGLQGDVHRLCKGLRGMGQSGREAWDEPERSAQWPGVTTCAHSCPVNDALVSAGHACMHENQVN
jgi:hypothetical protein